MPFWKKLPSFSPFIILFVASFPTWQPLLTPGFFPFHDTQQIARLFELDKALLAGQFPVRWVENLGFGFGYPLFNFYPPLVYYLGEFFHLVFRTGFIDSVKLVWFVALVGSALAMYFLAKELFGKIGGLVSAIFYLYAPYHAVDAYVRGSLAELFSFVWLPLILLFTYKSHKTNKTNYFVLTGVLLAFLMLTHNLIFLPFFGFYTIWFMATWMILRRHSLLLTANRYLLTATIAFGLSAFFWLPSLLEKQYTLVDQLLIKNLASYTLHFVCPQQLWNSPWGFGGSTTGCIDGLSFKIGKLHLLLAALSFIPTLYLWIKETSKLSFLLLASCSLLLVSLFMTTNYSKIIWDNVSLLWYLQFPWRFLEFATLFAALIAGSFVLLIRAKAIKAVLASILILAVIFLEAKNFRPQTFLLSDSDAIETSDEQIKWVVSSTSFEYLPREVATKTTELGALWVDIDRSKIPIRKYDVLSGNFEVFQERFNPHQFSLTGISNGGANLRVNITNFPTWKIYLDGQKQEVSDQNPYKLLTINVPAGYHTIIGQFTNTWPRVFGNTISLITLSLLILYFVRYGARRNS